MEKNNIEIIHERIIDEQLKLMDAIKYFLIALVEIKNKLFSIIQLRSYVF